MSDDAEQTRKAADRPKARRPGPAGDGDAKAEAKSAAKPIKRRRPPAEDAVRRELSLVTSQRCRSFVGVRQPLVLISQAPRSGGTLLMRLLDGHPQCHTVAHELNVGFGPSGRMLEGLDKAWQTMWFGSLQGYFEKGYKGHPFLLPPALHQRIFKLAVKKAEKGAIPLTERDVADAWMTGYFNAWLDNQNLYATNKRWVTGFSPRVVLERRRLERFEAIYPDGRLISLVRRPESWYPSARGRSLEWRRLEPAVGYWRSSVETVLAEHERLGDRHRVLLFEDLVGATAETMRGVAAFLRIDNVPLLTTPTFNGRPTVPNSSFNLNDRDVSTSPLEQYKTTLSAAEIAKVHDTAGDAYERAAEVAWRPKAQLGVLSPGVPDDRTASASSSSA